MRAIKHDTNKAGTRLAICAHGEFFRVYIERMNYSRGRDVLTWRYLNGRGCPNNGNMTRTEAETVFARRIKGTAR
jgi:hypothetical protein